MRHGLHFIADIPTVHYADLVRRVGGKARLRRAGRVTVVFTDAAGPHPVELQLAEVASWRGGSRSYITCPSCSARVLRVLWNESVSRAQCSRCWSTGRLRYYSQEGRRVQAGLGGDQGEQQPSAETSR